MNKKDLLRKLKIELGMIKFMDFPMLEGDAIVRAEALEVGQAALLVADDGSESPAPEGEHALADGTKIRVDAEGLITEVMMPEGEAEAEIEIEMKKILSENQALKAEIESLKTNLSAKDAEVKTINERFSQVEKLVAELSEEPAAKPIKAGATTTFSKEENKSVKVDLANMTIEQRSVYFMNQNYSN